ncbi:MAG: hypothetical protein LUI09_06970, partial [Prevotellaceae bacterium]|nr:hypothetical protein [Prevotellaceae bacterium]
MTDDKAFQQMAAEAKDCLAKGRLRDALILLSSLTIDAGDTKLSDRRTAISDDYERMLRFLRLNGKDDTRAEQHLRLMQKTIALLQDTRREFRLRHSDDIYCRTWRQCQSNTSTVDFTEADRTFNIIWTAPQLTDEAKDFITSQLQNQDSDDAPYYLSALTLSLLEYFDAAKLEILLHYCASPDVELRSRSLVGACVCSQLHSSFLQFYPTLLEMYRTLNLNAEIALVQHNFCIYQEGARIHKKFKEEILPNLRKAQEQRRKLGFEAEELDLEDADNILDSRTKSRLQKSFKEMAALFVDGVDINLETFGTLKKFPFFAEPCHWLRPFSTKLVGDTMGAIIQSLHLCDADKYSFCLFFNSMPDSKAANMKQQLAEGLREPHRKPSKRSPEDAYQNVIQCLSRLLRRSPWSSGWPAVFSPKLLFVNSPALKSSLASDGNYLHRTAETLLRYGHYTDAKTHLELLLKLEGSTAGLLAALATCEEKEGNAFKAASLLRQALLLDPQNKKLLHRLQACLAMAGQHEAQLDCLLQLESLDPEDERTLVDCGMCLMQLERWKEAQQRFFKLELSGKRVIPSTRAVAWCALQLGDLPTAHRYYHWLVEENPQGACWEDCLNCAHTEWL